MGAEAVPIVTAKQLLRAKVKAALLEINQKQLLEQSSNVCKVLSSLSVYKKASKIAFFMNMPTSEVKTLPLIQQAFVDKKRIFLPKISKLSETHELQRFSKQRSQLEMLEIPNMEAIGELTPVGPFKLLEPLSGTNALSDEVKGLDLIIIPGVAFTKTCFRMGHGAGFYDDYIKRHSEAGYSRPRLVGVGLKEQLVENIPLEEHDEILDSVIIDDQYYEGVKYEDI